MSVSTVTYPPAGEPAPATATAVAKPAKGVKKGGVK